MDPMRVRTNKAAKFSHGYPASANSRIRNCAPQMGATDVANVTGSKMVNVKVGPVTARSSEKRCPLDVG
jgi:hypothetical protein